MEKLDRIKGCLIGLAIGDALGVHHEFKPRKEVVPIFDYTEGNPYGIPKGYWTDDTSMALCMAQSLIEKKEFDATDIMQKFCQWQRKGFASSTGTCFDIGNTTRTALMEFWRDPSKGPFRGLDDVLSAGNGSIMRLAPIPMFYHNDMNKAIEFAALSSKITHGYVECVDACKFLAEILWKLINGYAQLNNAIGQILLYKDSVAGEIVFETENKFCPKVQTIVNGSIFHKTIEDVRGSGYVVDSLEASLYSFVRSKGNTFETAVLTAVNMGDDADTTGAITGQLAVAYYGYEAIPEYLKSGLAYHDMIVQTAEELYKVSVENEI